MNEPSARRSFPAGEYPAAADLYCDIQPMERLTWREYLPGLVVAAVATLSAAYLSSHYNAPLTLMAMLVGLALNFLGADRRLAPGLTFASQTLLKIGIVVVGARVTLDQVIDLGPVALVALVAVMTATILAAIAIGRLLKFDAAFGTLVGGAVAICGASAALALATILGERRIAQTQLLLVLVGIAAMSSLAMALYPLLARQLGLDDTAAGFMLGGSIHDVAQALGAGYSFSDHAGETAAIVKLSRVALLVPILVIVARLFARSASAGRRPAALPWFVIGFAVVALINSAGFIPALVAGASQPVSSALLACAVAAAAIRSPMGKLLEAGPRPLALIALTSLVALASALCGSYFIR